MIKNPNKKGAGTTLPKPLSSGDFVKRLEKALEEEKSKGNHDKLNLSQFRGVVLATAKGVADQDIVKPWVLAVWVR